MILTITVQQLVQKMVSTGVHLGHQRSQQNPKMLPYIYKEKDDLQFLDLRKTYWYLKRAASLLFKASSRGKRVLFVGTKKHVAPCIEKIAKECNSWYINKRWLGGLLTNWKTMRQTIFQLQRGTFSLSKKEKAQKDRQRKRLLKYLGGVQTMYQLPDIVIIIGQHKEMKAVRECQKLKIPSLTILDTNCDPSLTRFFIPANDDSLASITYILNTLSKAIQKGQYKYEKEKQIQERNKRKSLHRYRFKKIKKRWRNS
uniref:Small ribosomal subunit protein uS2c n=1 Tax=Boodleopsis pusilla TaxID=381415 RepID=A0A386AZG9_9CHLO|nr:ribosomal protein S2 [Boodleopsis pusilla]AYC64831.1 ribosomal protein S2 [Boodleopsis pusilla]